MLVSIIIPSFNRCHLLGQTLKSILNQIHKEWECLVVDDGSKDYTEELMEFYTEDPRIKFLKRESFPKGASHCRNIGLKSAKGEYCIFLDSDDMLLPDCLKERLKMAKDHPEKHFYVFPMFTQYKDKKEVAKIPDAESYISEFLLYRIHWQTMCTLWETGFVISIGGFNEAYPRLNDPEIHIRAMLVSENNFIVFNHLPPDTVYRIAQDPRNKKKFALNYYDSLILLASEIPRFLKEYHQEEKIPYLKEYLNDYLRISFQFIKRKKNLKLFQLFYKNKILGLREYLKLCGDYYKYLASQKGLLRKENIKLILPEQ